MRRAAAIVLGMTFASGMVVAALSRDPLAVVFWAVVFLAFARAVFGR